MVFCLSLQLDIGSVHGVGEGQKDHQAILFPQTMLIGLLPAIGLNCQVVYKVVHKIKTPGKLLTKRFGRCDGDGLVIRMVDGRFYIVWLLQDEPVWTGSSNQPRTGPGFDCLWLKLDFPFSTQHPDYLTRHHAVSYLAPQQPHTTLGQ